MILFMDGFEHYGLGDSGRSAMLDNVYAVVGSGCQPSDTYSRTGDRSLRFTAINGQSLRRVFPSSVGEVFAGFVFYAPELPGETDRLGIQLRDANNDDLVTLVVLPTGALAVRQSLTDANIAATAGPVIGAASWNHIEMRAVESSGTVEVRVNGVEVLATTEFSFTESFAQWGLVGRGAGGGNVEFYFDDLIVNDASGSYNTSWKGDLRVATLFPNEDETPSGWTRYGRDKFGTGVLWAEDDSFIAYADVAGFDIGSGDWTVEGFWRFDSEPLSGVQTLCGQFDTLNNERSWRLYRDFDDAGALKLEVSTDGTSATAVEVFRWDDYAFEVGRYYHVAVSRVSGTTYLFIDGRIQGAGASDSNTYHNSTSDLWIGAQQNGMSSAAVSDAVADFTLDEFRLTVGTGRYSANFTPPSAAFPRSESGDPDFADVQLLLGFNQTPILDESSNDLPVETGSAVALDVSEDAQGKYAVVNDPTPRDTTYIAADFIFATGELTLTGNPSDTETVTLGSTTYEFVDTLSAANDVLIGEDADESLQNLAAAINGGSGEGTIYGTGTVANTAAAAEWLGSNQLRATAAAQGAAGNSVATTETLADGSWTDSTLTGGADIPAAQEFSFSPLPIDTTAVRGIQLYHRSRKSDSGACNVQTSFHVGSASDDGADRPITTAYAFYTDVFEQDPDTEAGLTVNSITSGQFQINRTT